jgi:GrpB-like predicted nucleotidyltransferase (UPF0157 family)
MKKYVFRPYSLIFPELYLKEKSRIASHINHHAQIEHIGSTAVPGLGGKGVIDMGIAIDRKEMESVSEQLQVIGYEFRPVFSTPDRLYFITFLEDAEEPNRRYHIHLTYPENKEWKEFLGFRDYLINHPIELQEYADLKEKAALQSDGQGEKYRDLKEPLINKIKNNLKF